MKTIWVLHLWLLVAECHGARILAFLPINAHSHQNTYRPIFRELAKRGHDVTYVTSIPDSKAPYKQIVIENHASDMDVEMDFFSHRKKGFWGDVQLVFDFLKYSTLSTLSNPEVQKLINSTDLHFDLVVTESMIEQESYAVFGHKFQAPVIELSSISPMFWLYHLMGNPYSFSYTASMFTRSTSKMDFMERMRNTIHGACSLLHSRFYSLPIHEAIAQEYFRYPGSESRPPLIDLLSNVSLVLVATHFTTHTPHPYNPNIVEIGGIQLEQPVKLPQDLQQYLDNASEGVIYFSLGSILKSYLMPSTTQEALVSAFAKLPYKVLWKWEAEALPEQPKNVKVAKWLPQKDILAHPNVKLFLTHGGLGGYTEAIYHGVPVVVIPVFVDQWKNSKQVEAVGNGLYLNFDNITEQSVIWAVTEVLGNHSYRQVAQTQSRIFRDRPMSAMDTAMYWIEYVLRHKGAPHLRTAAATLPWYKYFLVDVVAVLLSTFIFALIIIYLALRTTYRFLKAKFNLSVGGKRKMKIN